MVLNKVKELSVRFILLTVLFFLLFIGLIYKYFEWATLKQLSSLYNENWSKELTLTAEHTKTNTLGIESNQKLTELFNDTKATSGAILNQLQEIDRVTNLELNFLEEYENNLNKNITEYSKIKFKANFLLGKRGKFVRKLLKLQEDYYKIESANNKESFISTYLVKNIYIAFQDMVILTEFDQENQNDPKNTIPKNFFNISNLEKYSLPSFKFDHEDEIKKTFPYGNEVLSRYRSYFSSYFSLMKDFSAGDYESFNYKYPKLEEDARNLNIDWTKLGNENKESGIEESKKVVQLINDNITLVKQFKKENLGAYPLLSDVNRWEEDMVHCQFYEFKTGIYYSIYQKYPEAKNIDDLMKKLSDVTPRTDIIDNLFNKNAVRFKEDNKSITFECKNNVTNRWMIYTITK